MATVLLDVTATVPSQTSLDITVYEDVGDDGSGGKTDPNGKAYDNSDTASINDGSHHYHLTGFQGGSGNAYWIQVEPGGTDNTRTASLDSVQATVYPNLAVIGKPVMGTSTAMGGGTETTATGRSGFIKWETAQDWDNAVSESKVWHPSDEIHLDITWDDFDSYASGATSFGPWTVSAGSGAIDTTNSYSGDRSVYFDGSVNSGVITVMMYADFEPEQYSSAQWVYRETSSSNGHGFRFLDGNGNTIVKGGTGNPQVEVYTGNGLITMESGPSPNYGEWRRYTVTFDWANQTVDILWEDLTGSTGDRSLSGEPFVNTNATALGRSETINDDVDQKHGTANDAWVEDATGMYVSSGSLKTASKEFPLRIKPELTELGYQLNGESISLDIIGSPGQFAEETVNVSLTGKNDVDITSWSGTHEEFQVKMNFGSGGASLPIFSRAGLAANFLRLMSPIVGQAKAIDFRGPGPQFSIRLSSSAGLPHTFDEATDFTRIFTQRLRVPQDILLALVQSARNANALFTGKQSSPDLTQTVKTAKAKFDFRNILDDWDIK